MEELLPLVGAQMERFLEMESTPGDGAVKVVAMTAKDLEYSVNIVDEAASGGERTDSSWEEVLLQVKCDQTASQATEKSPVKGTVGRWADLTAVSS